MATWIAFNHLSCSNPPAGTNKSTHNTSKLKRSFGNEISANLRAGHQLSSDDKKYILGCLDAGASAREVARKLGCAHTTISSIKKRYDQHGTVERHEQSNRYEGLTSHDKKNIMFYVKINPRATLDEVQGLFYIKASKATISRFMRDHKKNKRDNKRRLARLEAQNDRILTRQSIKLAKKSIAKKKKK